MTVETWKVADDVFNNYEVSNLGRIRRIETIITDSLGRKRKIPEKMLKHTNSEGYLIVTLYKKNEYKKFYVHVLVARAFIPNLENKPYVNHIDRNRSNAVAKNLEWVTQSENIKKAHDMTTLEKEKIKKKNVFTEVPINETEIWKEIEGYTEYEVSNLGKVRRKSGFLIDSRGIRRYITGKILTPRKDSKNKYVIELRKNNKSKFIYLHRIVAEAFIPNPENKIFVSHVDGNPLNNTMFNLNWVTSSEISKLKSDFTKKGEVEKAPEILVTGEEIWRDIVGYEGYYQVSNYGQVKSLNRVIKIGKSKGKRLLKERKLLIKSKKGYSIVKLSKNGKGQNIFVHRLVADAFIPNPETKSYVNHINNIKHDNRVENLEWVTAKENTEHMSSQNRGSIKAVQQFDLNGNFIKEFPSLKNAADETGISYYTLIDMFKRKKQMCAGYQWRLVNDSTKIEQYKDPSEVEVNQYTLSGEFIRNYSSIKSAADYLKKQGIEKACPSCISKACKGKLNYAFDYQWRYTNDKRPLLSLIPRVQRIVQLTIEGEFIKIHKHIRAAEIDIGVKIDTSGISKCCNGKQNSAHGFKWMREDNYIKIQDKEDK